MTFDNASKQGNTFHAEVSQMRDWVAARLRSALTTTVLRIRRQGTRATSSLDVRCLTASGKTKGSRRQGRFREQCLRVFCLGYTRGLSGRVIWDVVVGDQNGGGRRYGKQVDRHSGNCVISKRSVSVGRLLSNRYSSGSDIQVLPVP
jgi:hypothetical protein